MRLKKFPFYKQLDHADCGPSCLRMIAKYYGKIVTREHFIEESKQNKLGSSISGLADAAESVGLKTLLVNIPFDTLKDEAPLPCIAYWRQKHFVIVYKITKTKVYVADPAHGLITYSIQQFLDGWILQDDSEGNGKGLLLLIEPSTDFSRIEKQSNESNKGIKFLIPYFSKYKKVLVQLLLGILAGSVIQLTIPFITQAVVDYGINYQNIDFIYIMLFAQLMLFFSQSVISIIRDWLLLHLGAKINIALVSDFLVKLMKLPIHFFESKMIGDLMQRVSDHKRIEVFLSTQTLNIVFSVFSMIIFGIVLFYFNNYIFLCYLIGTILYILWVLIFMKKRARLDYLSFDQASHNQSNFIQLINGMQEIKLNNSERRRRWEWEAIQVKLYKISIKGLSLTQFQRNGGMIISEFKNILITFIAAKAVIDGQLTLGTMLSIQYIIGQLNNPIRLFIGFIQSYQDARISLERLVEIHTKEDENDETKKLSSELPSDKTVNFENVSFRYGASSSPLVLENISLTLPAGKITAIVGASGSGKTTLLKLLLKFYKIQQGKIRVSNRELLDVETKSWRSKCGVVMQDGYIFNDSIARNITESDSEGIIDKEKLLKSVKIANLYSFIESLPAGYNTKLGEEGVSLSGGQMQRILIARAVYKNPDYLFFDEATSSLDANNEKVIMENLEDFYKGKTVVVVAHRLSTVKNADQIIVLDDGKIIEKGNHQELSMKKGAYYELVKNQLELGN